MTLLLFIICPILSLIFVSLEYFTYLKKGEVPYSVKLARNILEIVIVILFFITIITFTFNIIESEIFTYSLIYSGGMLSYYFGFEIPKLAKQNCETTNSNTREIL